MSNCDSFLMLWKINVCRSEEVISFFWRSVYMHVFLGFCIHLDTKNSMKMELYCGVITHVIIHYFTFIPAYSRIFRNIQKYFRIIQSIPKYSYWIFQNIPKYSRIHIENIPKPNIPKYSRIFQNMTKYSRIFQNIPTKVFQNIPEYFGKKTCKAVM